MKKDSISKNLLYNISYQIMLILLPLVTTPYISRVLQVDGVGIYSYTYSYISVFVMIGSLGIAFYGQREVAAHSKNINEYSKIFWNLETLKLVTLVISCAIYIIISLNSREYKIYFLIQLPYFLAALMEISWLFQGLEVFKSVALKNMAIKLIGLVCIFVFVREKTDLNKYLIILCIAQIVGDASLWVQLPKVISVQKPQLAEIKRHFKQVLIYFIPTVSFQIYAFADKAMLGLFTGGPTENGYYEQGLKILNMCMTFVSAYTIILRSRMTNYFVDKDWTQFSKQLKTSLSLIALVTFPMGLGVAAIATNLVPWFFGSGYDKVIILIWMSGPLLLIRGIRGCLGSHIIAPCNLMSKGNIVEVTATIINVILNYFFIQYWSSIGALIATIIAEIVIFIGYMYYCRDYVRWPLIVKSSYKYLIASCIMVIPVFIFSEKLTPTIFHSVLLVLVGAIIYSILLIITKDEFFKMTIDIVLTKLHINKKA